MPLIRRRRAPLRRRRPARRYVRRAPRLRLRRALPNNMATATENISINFLANTWTNFNDLNMSQFPRAASIAQDYQKYRITKLEFSIKPYADTYIAGATPSIPYLYRMMDKNGSLPTTGTLTLMKNLGAKPLRFDDKTIKFTYKPTVLVDTQASGAAPLSTVNARVISSPWLSTSASPDTAVWSSSTVPHYGMALYLDAFGLVSNPLVLVDVVAHFEFKMPLFATR